MHKLLLLLLNEIRMYSKCRNRNHTATFLALFMLVLFFRETTEGFAFIRISGGSGSRTRHLLRPKRSEKEHNRFQFSYFCRTVLYLNNSNREEFHSPQNVTVSSTNLSSRERALSALSNPTHKRRKRKPTFNATSSVRRNHHSTRRRRRTEVSSGGAGGSSEKVNVTDVSSTPTTSPVSFSSLLPPPLEDDSSSKRRNSKGSSLSSGLSSWEDFLGARENPKTNSKNDPSPDSILPSSSSQLKLPAIEDLFPPDISSTPVSAPNSNSGAPHKPMLDGVLPVSDLFYRAGGRSSSSAPTVTADDENFEHDDEELPFSSEYSDALYSTDNSAVLRQKSAETDEMSKLANKRKGSRRMVRRGMEMLVGGVPIHADPPQRSIELSYDDTTDDWASVISLNTDVFGPLLQTGAGEKVSSFERGLFCEYFVHAAMKWDICPADLREIVKKHKIREAQQKSTQSDQNIDGQGTIKHEKKRKGKFTDRESPRGFAKEKGNTMASCVFDSYSKCNAKNAPFGGKIGMELLQAVEKHFEVRKPQVIAIGDVHGCVDELQSLLRECDYRPGDVIVFLGDLVCKGPDSISVIQMAREIGALSVRGNHDFEIIRWHQAIKSGVDPPVIGSEHFHIASCLSNADMKYLFNLPWYISSKELQCLFVHAGFVSGIRLSKQNPRLMMNMRSILPDGTVTSKMYSSWPWARLWDGPQTVLFGHDADRGLQQYEHCIGLDTGCVYGGRLTACILPERRLVSVSARREYFKYRRKHYD